MNQAKPLFGVISLMTLSVSGTLFWGLTQTTHIGGHWCHEE